MKLVVPPIKSQGIKTKLSEWIKQSSESISYDRWVEPFLGTGAVVFNVRPNIALLCDSNPHLIKFYQAIQNGEVTSITARDFLEQEGAKLKESDGKHYYEIRSRFNASGSPFDFLFLTRSCFNGMMRFNKSGGFNVPFCKKPRRFAPSLVTKICNQISAVSDIMRVSDYTFKNQPYCLTITDSDSCDLIYCDPPYVGRNVDYFDSWSEEEELDLRNKLLRSDASFILSTWLSNKYRVNQHVFSTWQNSNVCLREHFYHVGAKEANRNSVYEALISNRVLNGSVPTQQLLEIMNSDDLPSLLQKDVPKPI